MLNHLFREFFCLMCEEEAVGPEAVIGDLLAVFELIFDKVEFVVPEVEPFDKPKAVAPCMVVLLVTMVNFNQEVLLLIEIPLVNLHYTAPVVPYLEVLLQL